MGKHPLFELVANLCCFLPAKGCWKRDTEQSGKTRRPFNFAGCSFTATSASWLFFGIHSRGNHSQSSTLCQQGAVRRPDGWLGQGVLGGGMCPVFRMCLSPNSLAPLWPVHVQQCIVSTFSRKGLCHAVIHSTFADVSSCFSISTRVYRETTRIILDDQLVANFFSHIELPKGFSGDLFTRWHSSNCAETFRGLALYAMFLRIPTEAVDGTLRS